MSDLRITKYGKDEGEVQAGERVQYTVIVDNLGPSYAPGASIKDILSSSGEFTIENFASDRPRRARRTTRRPARTRVEYRFDCTLDEPLETLAADGDPNPGRWIVTYDLVANEQQDINNTATATSDALDPDESNNQAHVLHEITASADLEISKTDDTDPVVAGEALDYTIDVTNNGVSTAENVVVVDTLPLEVSIDQHLAAGQRALRGGSVGAGQPGGHMPPRHDGRGRDADDHDRHAGGPRRA